MFNSAAVEVIAVPLIASLSVTTLNVPLSSILATSVPSLCWNIKSFASTTGLIITSLDELLIRKISVPSSLKLKSPPPASKIISAFASSVIEEPESISAITGVVSVLFVSVSAKFVEASVVVALGKVITALPENAECAGACILA